MKHFIPRFTACVLSVLLLLGNVFAANAVFQDVGGHWATTYIEKAAAMGLVAGTSETTFSPNDSLSRGMLVTMLWRVAGQPSASGCRFTDVPSGSWYEAAVCWASEAGIVAGISESAFAPNINATREQVCAILARYTAFLGKKLPVVQSAASFHDNSQISPWAKASVSTLQTSGIVSGADDGCFYPLRPITRAETAVLFVRYADAVGKLSATRNLVNPSRAITYEQMMTDLHTLAAAYPGLITLSSAGKSLEGRDIPLVCFGRGSKYLFLSGAVHALEHVSTNYLLEMLDEYAFAYVTDGSYCGYDLHKLLNEFTLVILPRVNPDGVNISQNGFDAGNNPAALRAMIGSGKGSTLWKANAAGTDINRNFPLAWPQADGLFYSSPAYAYFGGYAAADAPETKAVLAVMEAHHYEGFLDIHLAGNWLYWGDDGISDDLLASSKTLAQKFAAVSGYTVGAIGSVSPCLANYARNHYQVPAITVELWPTTVFPIDYSGFHDKLWLRAQTFPLIAMTYFS